VFFFFFASKSQIIQYEIFLQDPFYH